MSDKTARYAIPSPYVLVLRDAPERSLREYERLEQQFNDLYHLFLAKVTRLPQEPAPAALQEEKLLHLFRELLALKKRLDS